MTRLPDGPDAGLDVLVECRPWPEVQEAIESGTRTVIIPTGAIEQHGRHLPLLVDAEHATAIGIALARELGEAFVAPTVRVGCSEHHLDFPGTISFTHSTFEAVLRDYCRSLTRHGFETILIFSCHGGNFNILREAEPRLNDAVAPDAQVFTWADIGIFTDTLRGVIEEQAGLGHRAGIHADITESSILLALRPELVRPDAAEPGYMGTVDAALAERLWVEGFKAITENGVLGDPTGMDARLGWACMASLTALLADHFRERVAGTTTERERAS